MNSYLLHADHHSSVFYASFLAMYSHEFSQKLIDVYINLESCCHKNFDWYWIRKNEEIKQLSEVSQRFTSSIIVFSESVNLISCPSSFFENKSIIRNRSTSSFVNIQNVSFIDNIYFLKLHSFPDLIHCDYVNVQFTWKMWMNFSFYTVNRFQM